MSTARTDKRREARARKSLEEVSSWIDAAAESLHKADPKHPHALLVEPDRLHDAAGAFVASRGVDWDGARQHRVMMGNILTAMAGREGANVNDRVAAAREFFDDTVASTELIYAKAGT